MRSKTAVITIFSAFVVCVVLNGVFHALIIQSYFDNAFAAFGDKINKVAESNPAWQIATELVWVSALFYLLAVRAEGKINTRHAVIGGMLMNAAVSATWNFINASLFTVFPTSFILPDMAFHIFIVGSISGFVLASVYNRLEKAAA